MQNENSHRQVASGRLPPIDSTEPLKAERVQDELRAMPGWHSIRSGAAITRVFRFHGAETPMLFAALVDGLAREEGHHPMLTVTGREVICQLTSNEAGGVTLRDVRLARRISLLKE